MDNTKHFKLLLVLLLAANFTSLNYSNRQRRQKYRIINLEKIENCDEDENLPMYFTSISLRKPDVNHFELYGNILITEIIKGPVYLSVTVYRCDVDLNNCNNYNEFKVPQICRSTQVKNLFWSPMVDKIKPPLTCPTRIGNYTVSNGTWDLSVMAGLPLEGYRWLLWSRLYEENRTKPRKIFCLATTTHVTFGRATSGRTHK